MKPRWRDRALIRGPYLTLCTKQSHFDFVCRKLGVKEPPPFLGGLSADASTHQFQNQQHENTFVVCLRRTKGTSKIQVYALLAHEAMHVWRAHKESIGETEPSSEFEAYAIQHFTQELMLEHKRQTK